MKSITLMVTLLVVLQAVLIMGVFAAAVPIENRAVAGEEKVTPCPKSNPAFCNNCTTERNGSVKCQDKVANDKKSCENNVKWCKNCKERNDEYNPYYICYDDFSGNCCNKN